MDSCQTMQTFVSKDGQLEVSLLWSFQPVKLLDQQSDVLVH